MSKFASDLAARLAEHFRRSLVLQRLVLAFTTGLFLACAAQVSAVP